MKLVRGLFICDVCENAVSKAYHYVMSPKGKASSGPTPHIELAFCEKCGKNQDAMRGVLCKAKEELETWLKNETKKS